MTISRRDFSLGCLSTATALSLGAQSALAGPEHIIKRPIPSSGEMIPIVGIGTNRYGVGESITKRAPLRAALQRFHEWGGTLIDTAPGYRTSESVLGDLIADLGVRDDFFVATKVDRDVRADSESQMNDSLKKLRTDHFDLMQVHNLRGWEKSIPLLRDWKEDGRIRYIGITTSRARQYSLMEKIMRQEDLDFIQINYSLEQREAADRLLSLAADRGMGVIINRAFGGGRIFRQVGDRLLPDWASEFDCSSWAQFLLKYALGHPATTVAIPGMTKAHHVDDNFGAAHGRLPDATQRKQQEAFFDAF